MRGKFDLMDMSVYLTVTVRIDCTKKDITPRKRNILTEHEQWFSTEVNRISR